MSYITVNLSKRYLDHTKDRSKPICIIHGPGHSSDECKVLGDLGSKYAKSMTTKDRGRDLEKQNKFKGQQDNNAIFNHAVDDIILQEKQIKL